MLVGLQALGVAAVTVAWVGMTVILAARLLTMGYRITCGERVAVRRATQPKLFIWR